MIKLTELFDVKFRNLLVGVPDLSVGEYEVKRYYIFDNHKFVKTVYFDTDKGFFKSTSTTLIGSIYGGLGAILYEQFEKGETVLIEFVNKRSTSGKYGLAFRTV